MARSNVVHASFGLAALKAPAKPVRGKKRTGSVMPTDEEVQAIPLAKAGEYELSDRECKQLRKRIYSINKENVVGWRFRTLREGPLLLVWRIR